MQKRSENKRVFNSSFLPSFPSSFYPSFPSSFYPSFSFPIFSTFFFLFPSPLFFPSTFPPIFSPFAYSPSPFSSAAYLLQRFLAFARFLAIDLVSADVKAQQARSKDGLFISTRKECGEGKKKKREEINGKDAVEENEGRKKREE